MKLQEHLAHNFHDSDLQRGFVALGKIAPLPNL